MQPYHQSSPPPDHTPKVIAAGIVGAIAVGVIFYVKHQERQAEQEMYDSLALSDYDLQRALGVDLDELEGLADIPDGIDLTETLATSEWGPVTRNGFRIDVPGTPVPQGTESTGKLTVGGADFAMELSYAKRSEGKTAAELRETMAAQGFTVGELSSQSDDGKSRIYVSATLLGAPSVIGELRCDASETSINFVVSGQVRDSVQRVFERAANSLVCTERTADTDPTPSTSLPLSTPIKKIDTAWHVDAGEDGTVAIMPMLGAERLLKSSQIRSVIGLTDSLATLGDATRAEAHGGAAWIRTGDLKGEGHFAVSALSCDSAGFLVFATSETGEPAGVEKLALSFGCPDGTDLSNRADGAQ